MVLAAAAGCGGMTSTQGQPKRGLVYHVSISYSGVRQIGKAYTYTGWVDPAGRRQRTLQRVIGTASFEPSLFSIVLPDGGQVDSRFRQSFGGLSSRVLYGQKPQPAQQQAVWILRTWLGLPSPLGRHVRVSRDGGRTLLRVSLVSLRRLLRLQPSAEFGLSPALVSAPQGQYSRGTLVVTVLGAISVARADTRGLFRLDAADAGSVTRELPLGTRPSAGVAAYWLGPSAVGYTARTAQVIGSGISSSRPHTGYSVTYAPRGASGSAAATRSVDITTGDVFFPRPTMNTPGTVPITLADGSRAGFLYRNVNAPPPDITLPKSVKAGAGATASFSVVNVFGFEPGGFVHTRHSSTKPGAQVFRSPPEITVAAAHSIISIDVTGSITRAQALRIAEALRPV